MNLCSDDHDEICYEERMCPLCAVISEKKTLEETVGEKDEEIKDLNMEVDDLTKQVEELQKKIETT